MKRAWCLLAVGLLLAACSSTGGRRREIQPVHSRLKVERPGMGIELELEIAGLILDDKRVQAMRLCNDILFASRSKQDREAAYYWRRLLLLLDELEKDHYDKAMEILKREGKGATSATNQIHKQLITRLLESLVEQRITILDLADRNNQARRERQLSRLMEENQQLASELEETRRQNRKLEKLLQQLEGIK